jgi:hypothetical protein
MEKSVVSHHVSSKSKKPTINSENIILNKYKLFNA